MTNGIQLAPVKAINQNVQRINAERAWQQLCERDRSARFFYAVTTTGVFCRPECKSRRPLRENVRFFETIVDAKNAGFRACKRCKPADTTWGRPMELVRRHLESNLDRSVPLAE